LNSAFIQSLNMLKLTGNESGSLVEIEKDLMDANENRMALLNALRTLKPPESTKIAIYKWYDSVKEQTQKLKETNARYTNKLHENYEASNQTIINKMESLLVR
jgi:DNA repair ATPase RecN